MKVICIVASLRKMSATPSLPDHHIPLAHALIRVIHFLQPYTTLPAHVSSDIYHLAQVCALHETDPVEVLQLNARERKC
jgi:hypothetical protein